MTLNINSVTLGGRIIGEPQRRTLPSGTALTQFTLATNYVYTDSNKQERNELCYTDCKTFMRYIGDQIMELDRNVPVIVEGRLTLEQWMDRAKVRRRKHVIIVNSVNQLMTKIHDMPAGSEAPPSEGPEDGRVDRTTTKPKSKEQENYNPPGDDENPEDDGSFTEDDIPF